MTNRIKQIYPEDTRHLKICGRHSTMFLIGLTLMWVGAIITLSPDVPINQDVSRSSVK